MPSYLLVHIRGDLCTTLRKHKDVDFHACTLSLFYQT